MFSYFGIEEKDLTGANKDSIAKKCAQRAYLDLSRTLNFKEKADKKGLESDERKEIIKKHLTFRDEICKKIVKGIIEDLFQSKNADDFNNKHFEICDSIQKYAWGTDVLAINKLSDECKEKRKEECKSQKFYYGQAQKWLNMTLKYMWLLGLWKNDFVNIEEYLHVPVDSYIIKYVWKTDVILPILRKERGDYRSEKIVPWSKWTKMEYEKFQTSMETSFEFGESNLPLEWEGESWIRAAKGFILDKNMNVISTENA